MNSSPYLAASLDDVLAAAPLVVLSISALAALLAIAFVKRKATAAFATCAIGLALAIASSIALSLPLMPRNIEDLLSMDGISFVGTAIILGSSLAIALVSRPYLARREGERGEYYVLLLLAALGASALAASSSFATVFLGLELLSVSLYALVAYRRGDPVGTKAAFTYLILASTASAFLLFGMALAYFQTGSLELSRAAPSALGGPMMAAALAMMGVGFAFKLAVAPFHMWAMDVYEGAEAPTAALVATVSKAAMVIPLVRFLSPQLLAGGGAAASSAWIVAALSGASMIAGNLLALKEERVKRMLAGSSIAQVGYILVALIAGSNGAQAALFYLAAYSLSTLGAFACVAAISRPDAAPADAQAGPSDRPSGDARREDFRGLASRRPLVAAVMSASLLSLAGMPLTAGFIGKFLLFSAGVRAGAAARFLVVLLALNSALSIFYYLRLLSLMYRPADAARADVPGGAAFARPAGSFLAGASLALIGLAILALGMDPGPVIGLISTLVGPLAGR
jgi:NADH-quinone oxidoreductase subunit N